MYLTWRWLSSPGFPGGARGGATSASTWWMSGSGTASTRASTARTCPTCATGPGPTNKSRVRVLVLNAGSSSLKGSIVESVDFAAIAKAEVSLGADATKQKAIERTVRSLLSKLGVTGPHPDPAHAGNPATLTTMAPPQAGEGYPIGAVGHRVVHGGTRFLSAVRVDDRVLKGIEALAEFAPLHNPVAAAAIRAARSALPNVPQVAAFDTAFHATLSEEQFLYPVPWRWHREYGIRRFGFHGLSVEWSTRRAAALLSRPAADPALVVAHLGSGCSVTAVRNGRSVAPSMGPTPRAGLLMGPRSRS